MQPVHSPLINLRMIPQAKTSVLVIGGAEDKVHGREILHAFFEAAGGPKARIGVLPCASREPAVIAERYQHIFQEMGAEAIAIFDIQERFQGEDPLWQTHLDDCTGIFITGGDQVRLCGLIADTPFIALVRQRVFAGQLVLAGTSAGAAIMGQHMIAGGGSGEPPNRSLVDMATGLGFLPEVIVDQHFHNRNRMSRLISAIAIQPDRVGLGIDEDTCALFSEDGTFRVLGKGVVAVIDPIQMVHTNLPEVSANEPISVHNLKVHFLVHGDRYSVKYRRLLGSASISQ